MKQWLCQTRSPFVGQRTVAALDPVSRACFIPSLSLLPSKQRSRLACTMGPGAALRMGSTVTQSPNKLNDENSRSIRHFCQLVMHASVMSKWISFLSDGCRASMCMLFFSKARDKAADCSVRSRIRECQKFRAGLQACVHHPGVWLNLFLFFCAGKKVSCGSRRTSKSQKK